MIISKLIKTQSHLVAFVHSAAQVRYLPIIQLQHLLHFAMDLLVKVVRYIIIMKDDSHENYYENTTSTFMIIIIIKSPPPLSSLQSPPSLLSSLSASSSSCYLGKTLKLVCFNVCEFPKNLSFD